MTVAAERAKVTAVLFDLDDTLYDHRHAITAALGEVCAAEPGLLHAGFDAMFRHYDAALEELHPQVVAGRISYEAARTERYRRLLVWADLPDTRAEELADMQLQSYLDNERLVPGTRALLNALRDRGLKLGIVSNSTRPEQTAKLQRLDIHQHFDTLVVSGDHGIAKPDARLFQIALSELSVAAGETVFVGDRWEIDVAGAQSAALRPVWFNRLGIPAPAADVPQLREFTNTAQALATLLA